MLSIGFGLIGNPIFFARRKPTSSSAWPEHLILANRKGRRCHGIEVRLVNSSVDR